jgi:DNA-directed RNA polymerase II subunit RPB2
MNGVIDRVHTGVYNSDGYEMYNVRIRMERTLMVGDKMTTRHGQKGTVGITYPYKDMPFTESGIVPDLILNPHGFPSRMSLGDFIECIASKEGAETGRFIDGTPFNNYDVSQFPEALKKLGYSPHGTEVMYCGLTGRKMDVEIFIGPMYNVRLKHMVLDKIHSRARGPKQALTRQPLEGRSQDGGLKIGEMEKDAIAAHGMAQFLKERLMETSDITKVHVCDICGLFASKVIDREYYTCKGCHNSTKISAVVIPYACKLLFQELTSVNILPRIRTEKSMNNNEL